MNKAVCQSWRALASASLESGDVVLNNSQVVPSVLWKMGLLPTTPYNVLVQTIASIGAAGSGSYDHSYKIPLDNLGLATGDFLELVLAAPVVSVASVGGVNASLSLYIGFTDGTNKSELLIATMTVNNSVTFTDKVFCVPEQYGTSYNWTHAYLRVVMANGSGGGSVTLTSANLIITHCKTSVI